MKLLVAACIAALSCAVTSAGAHTYVVDPSGSGDFTQIQPALDLVGAGNHPDTVLVLAGGYPEHITYPQANAAVLCCPSGPSSTTVLDFSMATPGAFVSTWWTTHGLGFVQPCSVSGMHQMASWEHCTFYAGFTGQRNCGAAELSDCDFYGPVQLLGYNTQTHPFTNLRFHHAPLVTSKLCGTLEYRSCSFQGQPGDVLVTATSVEDMQFTKCTFDVGSVGLSILGGYSYAENAVTGCVFRDLATGVVTSVSQTRSLPVSGCRFERCSRAIDGSGGALTLTADTLMDCGDRAVTGGAFTNIDGLVVTGGQGVAVDLSSTPSGPGIVHVTHSTFSQLGGAGLRVRGLLPSAGGFEAYVQHNQFIYCNGGVDVAAEHIVADHNVVYATNGPGLAFTFGTTSGPDYAGSSISDNTVAIGVLDAMTVAGGVPGDTAAPVIARNVLAQCGGVGLRLNAGAFGGAITHNIAWHNYADDYTGFSPGATNLVADPVFCDITTGDLTVSAGSPCAPGMPTGPMGALGVGCDTERLGVPPDAPALAFGVRPSPARGAVGFALPALAGAARLDVLDAQGRRVWSAPVATGARSASWLGQRDRGGRAGAGVYWVRLACGADVRVRRFVWLE